MNRELVVSTSLEALDAEGDRRFLASADDRRMGDDPVVIGLDIFVVQTGLHAFLVNRLGIEYRK